MEPETINALVDSHDELVRVVQACMSCILKHELLDALDGYMMVAEVKPGFAERAEIARKQAMRERIIHLC